MPTAHCGAGVHFSLIMDTRGRTCGIIRVNWSEILATKLAAVVDFSELPGFSMNFTKTSSFVAVKKNNVIRKSDK